MKKVNFDYNHLTITGRANPIISMTSLDIRIQIGLMMDKVVHHTQTTISDKVKAKVWAYCEKIFN